MANPTFGSYTAESTVEERPCVKRERGWWESYRNAPDIEALRADIGVLSGLVCPLPSIKVGGFFFLAGPAFPMG